MTPIYQVEAPVYKNKTFDLTSVNRILFELKPLVDAADIEAEDLSVKLHELGQGTKYFDEIHQLYLLINDYEFEQAQLAIVKLKQSIKTEVLS